LIIAKRSSTAFQQHLHETVYPARICCLSPKAEDANKDMQRQYELRVGLRNGRTSEQGFDEDDLCAEV
jgi:hypothetical protein